MEVQNRALLGVLILWLHAVAGYADSPQNLFADFESYAEGGFRPSLLDAPSGILFTNSTSSSANFVIEYANTGAGPFFTNNHYLTANGFFPGNGVSLGGVFGFTAVPPAPANRVSMDFAFIANSPAGCTITLTGYAADNHVIASNATSLPSLFSFDVGSTQITSPAYDIARFTTSVSNCSTGFDNIAVTVPEPSIVPPVQVVCPLT